MFLNNFVLYKGTLYPAPFVRRIQDIFGVYVSVSICLSGSLNTCMMPMCLYIYLSAVCLSGVYLLSTVCILYAVCRVSINYLLSVCLLSICLLSVVTPPPLCFQCLLLVCCTLLVSLVSVCVLYIFCLLSSVCRFYVRYITYCCLICACYLLSVFCLSAACQSSVYHSVCQNYNI